jgi:hypothetical protein
MVSASAERSQRSSWSLREAAVMNGRPGAGSVVVRMRTVPVSSGICR